MWTIVPVFHVFFRLLSWGKGHWLHTVCFGLVILEWPVYLQPFPCDGFFAGNHKYLINTNVLGWVFCWDLSQVQCDKRSSRFQKCSPSLWQFLAKKECCRGQPWILWKWSAIDLLHHLQHLSRPKDPCCMNFKFEVKKCQKKSSHILQPEFSPGCWVGSPRLTFPNIPDVLSRSLL